MIHRNRKGFTLIEMLVVIAIVAILVAIIVPTVTASTTRARAATDAANLRSVLAEANVIIFGGDNDVNETISHVREEGVVCKSYPNAVLKVVYAFPGFVDVYFVDGDSYYGLQYLSEVAANGSSDLSTSMPVISEIDPQWIQVG